MLRLSWLAALDPVLPGTAQCLLYLPIGGRLVYGTSGWRIDYFRETWLLSDTR
jgi:hypothetical protein